MSKVEAPASPPPPRYKQKPIPKIDVHTHIEPGALARTKRLMGPEGTVHVVNLSGGHAGRGLEQALADARTTGYATIFTNPDFRELFRGPGAGARMAVKIKQAADLGARGVKIHKGLGLGYGLDETHFVPVDDKGLDPIFDEAGKNKLPVAIHSGDPQAFWQPPGPDNERWDELRAHPGWSFWKHPVKWEEIFAQYERRVARHPKTIFIGVHFGNAPEEPERVARMLDKYKNLYVDTAARVPEIGRVDARHDAARMRAMFIKYQDRILFGTDAGIGLDEADLMLGSTGKDPLTPNDVVRFFDSTWRWFETNERNIPTPTTIQGNWNVDGIGLPDAVLEKVYWKNASKLLGIKLPE